MKEFERPLNGHDRLSTTLKDSQRLAVIPRDPETLMTTKDRLRHSATGNGVVQNHRPSTTDHSDTYHRPGTTDHLPKK